MIDHVTLTVKDVKAAKEFYEKVLATLGLKKLSDEDNEYCGFGEKRPFFWISAADNEHAISSPVHIAFSAKNKDQVDAFYQTAMNAGAKDNGAPGYHTEYGEGYYASFIFDPDRNNIEVVYRR